MHLQFSSKQKYIYKTNYIFIKPFVFSYKSTAIENDSKNILYQVIIIDIIKEQFNSKSNFNFLTNNVKGLQSLKSVLRYLSTLEIK